jgi:hypothetical protein
VTKKEAQSLDARLPQHLRQRADYIFTLLLYFDDRYLVNLPYISHGQLRSESGNLAVYSVLHNHGFLLRVLASFPGLLPPLCARKEHGVGRRPGNDATPRNNTLRTCVAVFFRVQMLSRTFLEYPESLAGILCV